ncbi:hypothetical protein J2T10_000069 [Paenarthrobacter nicotinovorans]|uniref:Scaffolding protein n=1 Tax=Paenarthrobacter nicotinovorans TaxID=29320 RepID=A0ABT9TFM7_PAENI|nr:hypothetical protein [Paenarthrobacter nicotinovorans]MDQ0100450.1 hypothetical protein [Paenarthrobacter nicotinovorans]
MSDTPATPAATPEPAAPAAATPAPEGTPAPVTPATAPAPEVKTYDEAFVETLRTERQQAEAAADAKIKAALKALGISDEAEDPLKAAQDAAATNAQERDNARATARDTSAELIVWRNAAELGVDPAAVTDSRAFERAIKDLDPADPKFGEAVKEAATNAAKNNPKLKAAAPAPGAGGADFAGGTGETVGIDARIAAAEKAGDHALAIKLKRQKAYTN